MSPATMELALPAPEALGRDRGRGSSGPTLEERVLDAWEDLGSGGRARCLVCGDRLEPSGCAGCGSSLS